jgi:hypothetical protein
MTNHNQDENLTPLKRLPYVPAGCDEVTFRIDGLDLEVIASFTERNGEICTVRLFFDFFIALNIRSENNLDANLPPRSETLYSFTQRSREEFKGFKIWFSNNRVLEIVCKSAQVDNEIY